jgi:hexosaminidase
MFSNKMKKIIITLLALFFFAIANSQTTILPLIPLPNNIQNYSGTFSLSDSTIIIADENNFEAQYLKKFLKDNYDFNLKISPTVPLSENFISLINIAPDKQTEVNTESYQVKITQIGIVISANSTAGLFYGIQSLIQLIPVEKSNQIMITCLQINDSPRYVWRGMHLDCSRHFFTKEEIKKYIDYLAMYKFNTFHWHLTDDQGWRIEIKQYPLLTSISSQRKETIIGKPVDSKGKPLKNIKYDNTSYGGFYTQAEIKEIVNYASDRHITIVPEIEMPGHSLAVLAAYPRFSCTGGPFETFKTWGVSEDVFCAGNDSTFAFIQNILTEVFDLFPGKYVHIGGDECMKDRWKGCEKCQKRIIDKKLKDEESLQSYFIMRIEKFVNQNGKQIIGWDEILEGGLAPNATVMSWRGTKGGIAAAKQGHKVIMTPGKPCYFDHYQSKERVAEPLAIGGYNPLDSVYNYDPTPKSLSAAEQKYILGAQGNVWTEYIRDFSQVEYMSIPRMCALAEVLWTKPENKNYKKFISRLGVHSQILGRMKVNYAKHFIIKNKK